MIRAATLVLVAIAHTAAISAPLDDLLARMRADQMQETREIQERLAKFRAAAKEREGMLKEVQGLIRKEEKRSRDMEKRFADGEKELINRREKLDALTVHYKEVLATAKLWAVDLKGQFLHSLVSTQIPDRIAPLDTIGDEERATTIADMNQLLYAALEELNQQGQVVRFNAEVTQPDGTRINAEVVRVGVFTASTEGRFLSFTDDARDLVILPRQPPGSFRSAAIDLQEAAEGHAPAVVDPSRGAILSLLVDAPDLLERIEQGGMIGYLIILIGIFGVLFAIGRSIALAMHMRRVRQQQHDIDHPKTNNALGRIAEVYHKHADMDQESREDRVHEAISEELPKLNWGLNMLRVLAAVAPLLGLLGTVTGMIQTFQAITLFGTGDPRMMAGGISQALVTTALGLSAAIPILLLLTMARSYSVRIRQIVEEQSLGLVAHAKEL